MDCKAALLLMMKISGRDKKQDAWIQLLHFHNNRTFCLYTVTLTVALIYILLIRCTVGEVKHLAALDMKPKLNKKIKLALYILLCNEHVECSNGDLYST